MKIPKPNGVIEGQTVRLCVNTLKKLKREIEELESHGAALSALRAVCVSVDLILKQLESREKEIVFLLESLERKDGNEFIQ